eukprot:NODE_7_length_67686_cov_1.621421.p51 type:complete len:136 gc:universal NODE_7_length_67686_cov_1.621421:29070-29477(+)
MTYFRYIVQYITNRFFDRFSFQQMTRNPKHGDSRIIRILLYSFHFITLSTIPIPMSDWIAISENIAICDKMAISPKTAGSIIISVNSRVLTNSSNKLCMSNQRIGSCYIAGKLAKYLLGCIYTNWKHQKSKKIKT